MASKRETGGEGRTPSVDVVVVGAGLAGTLSAIALARVGCTVALIDLQAEPQPEFRAEQLVGPVVDNLEVLGALTPMTAGQPKEPITLDTRLGRVIGRVTVSQYGVPYQKMVIGARTCLPPGVTTIFGRATGFETGAGRQIVTLADGRTVSARLLVLATGLSTVLPKRLGLTYRTIRRDHSVALGFDMAQEKHRPMPMSFVQHPASVKEKLDYLAVFPIGDTIRANLFTYQEAASPWVRAFCRDPGPMLDACLPGLDRVLGPYRVVDPIQMRSNDLRVLESPARDGVVVVGDAFQTPCPAAGTGIHRLLSDVFTLAEYVPGWLASPGMDYAKIGRYYADPDKCAADAEALRTAEYRRAVSTEQTFGWAFHRTHVDLRQRLKGAARAAMAGFRPLKPQQDAVALAT